MTARLWQIRKTCWFDRAWHWVGGPLRPVHTRQQSCRKRQQIDGENGDELLPETATLTGAEVLRQCCRFGQQFVAISGNNLLPGVDRPLYIASSRQHMQSSLYAIVHLSFRWSLQLFCCPSWLAGIDSYRDKPTIDLYKCNFMFLLILLHFQIVRSLVMRHQFMWRHRCSTWCSSHFNMLKVIHYSLCIRSRLIGAGLWSPTFFCRHNS